jgi:DNA-binding Lrp family transcriptional regulator
MTRLTKDPDPFEMVPHWVMNALSDQTGPMDLYLRLRQHYNREKNAAWPSQETLARLLNVSERTVIRWVKHLEDAGVIKVDRSVKDGKRAVNQYRLTARRVTPVSSDESLLGDKNVTRSSDKTVTSVVTKMSHKPDLRTKPSEPDEKPAPETEGQHVQRLTRIYTDRIKLSNYNAVFQIVRTAVRLDYTDDQIGPALSRLADHGRPVTKETLRIEMEGMTPFGSTAGERQLTADQARQEKLALMTQGGQNAITGS